jgi:hypothetical protein
MESRQPQVGGQGSWGPLSPRGAERVLEGWRYRYGLGQAYRLQVRSDGRGKWVMTGGPGGAEVMSPMTERRLAQWYWDRFGDVIAERQHTSEG